MRRRAADATGRPRQGEVLELFLFVVAATIVGGLTGLVAASFRLLLDFVAGLRQSLSQWSHGYTFLGLLVMMAVSATATAIAAWLVHRVEPHAEGSGIPRVEAIVEGRTEPGRFLILPIKYIGGLLAIGAGLALGREGPSVQMGGTIAVATSRILRRNRADMQILVAGGAAAGLATAFNAPLAGGVFVLEELFKRFDLRTTLATIVASGAGFACAQILIRNTADFTTPQLQAPRIADAPAVVVVGLLCGVLGVAYNRAIMASLRYVDVSKIPVVVRALAIGAAVGALGWFAPQMVGGGDNLTQQALLGHGTLLSACILLAVRFALGVVSYAATTPGGLFAPMLVLGTDTGLIVGLAGAYISPGHAPEAAGLALIGMAAFFTATVRAPVTGLILATEMTGSVVLLPPMLGACAVAMLIAMLFKSEPIYDALTARAAQAARRNAIEAK